MNKCNKLDDMHIKAYPQHVNKAMQKIKHNWDIMRSQGQSYFQQQQLL